MCQFCGGCNDILLKNYLKVLNFLKYAKYFLIFL